MLHILVLGRSFSYYIISSKIYLFRDWVPETRALKKLAVSKDLHIEHLMGQLDCGKLDVTHTCDREVILILLVQRFTSSGTGCLKHQLLKAMHETPSAITHWTY